MPKQSTHLHVFVSTRLTQGQRASDFSYTLPHEKLRFGQPCDTDRDVGPDGGCGCLRAFIGLDSGLGTTTGLVQRFDGTLPALAREIAASLVKQGWFKTAKEALSVARKEATSLAFAAGHFPLGTVVEWRAGVIHTRRTDSRTKTRAN